MRPMLAMETLAKETLAKPAIAFRCELICQ